MSILQNTYLWMIPSKEQKELRLNPGESVSFPFIECLDGGFSYDIWVMPGDASTRYYGMRLNEKQLYTAMKVRGEHAWQMYGNLWAAKGEHLLTITNASDKPAVLEAVLITRNSGYIHGNVASKHLEQLKNGADAEELLLADNLIGENGESEESKQKRLQTLYSWGFIDRFDQDVSTGNCRCGVPLGGIGAGKIELDPHGILTAITINHNYELPIYRTDASLFGAYAKPEGDSAQSVLLQDENISINSFDRMCDSIDFIGRFPRAELRYHAKDFPVEISLSAFSSLIEQDESMSALPAFAAEFTVYNPSEKPTEAAILFSMENLLGVGGSMVQKSRDEKHPSLTVMNTWNPAYTVHNRENNRQTQKGNALIFTGGTETDPSYRGEYCMLCGGADALSVCASFEATNMTALWSQFSKDGTLPSAQPAAQKPAGAMSAKIHLNAGEKKKISFVFAWYLPTYLDADGKDWGVYYDNHFGSAWDAAQFMENNRIMLYRKTKAYEDKLFDSDLPLWLKEKLLNDRFSIYSCSIFTKDGRFAINEAPTGMMGCLGTLDQRLASQIYYSNFFPVLDKTELTLFANIQGADGSISHDLGSEKIYTEPHTGTWSDLCSSFILQSYRYAITSGDGAFLQAMYPKMQKAVAYQLTTDFDDDGIPDVGAGHGTTYDTYHWYGCCAFVASLWLAELKCCVKAAALLGDTAFTEKCERLFERAQKSMIEKLWTDEFGYGYFRNYLDTAGGRESKNCFIAQLAGVWFADSLDLGEILPSSYVEETFSTIAKRNLRLGDIKLMSDETTPEGDPAWFGYTFIQYDESYYACPAIRRGFVEDGLEVYRRIAALPNPWNMGLTYFTDGKFMGLPYYMTNPASIALIEAYSGFLPDALRGVVHLAPVCEFENLPLYAPTFEAKVSMKNNVLTVEVIRVNAAFTGLKLPGFTSCAVSENDCEQIDGIFSVGDRLAKGDVIRATR